MATLLHILTKPGDALAREVIERERVEPGVAVEVVDLTERKPDYAKLVERIFNADSVQVW